MDFRFTTEHPASRTDEIVDYLTGPRLMVPKSNYPDIGDWAQRVHGQIRNETKRAMIALSRAEIIGVTIFQRSKKDASALEIKNLTVRPDFRGRLIASFLLRNTEMEGLREYGSSHVVCDAKANNFQVRSFLVKQGYEVIGQSDLYGLGTGEDTIYRKSLESLALRLPRKLSI